ALSYYAPVQLYSLISMAEACADAGLDWRAGDLSEAAILAARDGGDCWSQPYADIRNADPYKLTKEEINDLGIRMALTGLPVDVSNVQVSTVCATGPNFTVSNGCTSSAVLLGM